MYSVSGAKGGPGLERSWTELKDGRRRQGGGLFRFKRRGDETLTRILHVDGDGSKTNLET